MGRVTAKRLAAALALALALALVVAGDRASAQASPPRGAAPEDVGIAPAPPDLSDTARVLALAAAALSLLPGSLGFDASVGPAVTDAPRMLVGWPVQVPVRPGGSVTRTAPYTNHRVVLAPELAIGEQRAARAGEVAAVTFRARVGYRAVVHPRGGAVGVLAGVGSAVEFWPVVRPSLSPELGVRVGACCDEAAFVLALVARADVFAAGDNGVRVGAALAWSFY